MASILDLSTEVLVEIFGHLPYSDVITNVSLVCRAFNKACSLIPSDKITFKSGNNIRVGQNVRRLEVCINSELANVPKGEEEETLSKLAKSLMSHEQVTTLTGGLTLSDIPMPLDIVDTISSMPSLKELQWKHFYRHDVHLALIAEMIARCKQLEVLKISTCSYVMLEHIIRSMPERVIHLEVDEISYWDWNQDNNDVLELLSGKGLKTLKLPYSPFQRWNVLARCATLKTLKLTFNATLNKFDTVDPEAVNLISRQPKLESIRILHVTLIANMSPAYNRCWELLPNVTVLKLDIQKSRLLDDIAFFMNGIAKNCKRLEDLSLKSQDAFQFSSHPLDFVETMSALKRLRVELRSMDTRKARQLISKLILPMIPEVESLSLAGFQCDHKLLEKVATCCPKVKRLYFEHDCTLLCNHGCKVIWP